MISWENIAKTMAKARIKRRKDYDPKCKCTGCKVKTMLLIGKKKSKPQGRAGRGKDW